MIKMRVFNLAVFVLFAAMPLSGQFAYDDYKPSTLRDVFMIGTNECGEIAHFTAAIVNGKKAFRVAASWNGKTREISKDVSGLLTLYEKVKKPRMTQQVSFRDLFKTEVLVSDDGREYWLPIQEQILDAFKKEVGPVKKVTLYVLYFGCIAKDPVPVAVIISEFEAIRGGKSSSE